MSKNFMESQTKENLMRAFAGESMARNRYVFSGDYAASQKMHVLEHLFRFTANQEQQHAKIFYNHLKELSGETIVLEAGYPIDNYEDIGKLLRAAEHNEYEEYDPIYQKFGNIAQEEGFSKAAMSFHQIATIERIHGERFGRFAELVEKDKLFVCDVETDWICLKCGYVHHGQEAPNQCPVCNHRQGYFIRLTMCPFEN